MKKLLLIIGITLTACIQSYAGSVPTSIIYQWLFRWYGAVKIYKIQYGNLLQASYGNMLMPVGTIIYPVRISTAGGKAIYTVYFFQDSFNYWHGYTANTEYY